METKTFIIKARKIHGNKYNYSKVDYLNSKCGVDILCSSHGVFNQSPSNHLQGQGCKQCGDDRQTLTTVEFIKRATKIHGVTYDYTSSQYINSHCKISIGCSIHGLFSQTPNDHLSGYGCSSCSNNKKMTTNDFVKKATIVHGIIYD